MACPICKSVDNYEIENQKLWHGVKAPQHICTYLRHWCNDPEDNYNQIKIGIRARDEQTALSIWEKM